MTAINLFRNASDVREARPGDVLFSEGEKGESMIAVVDGTVQLQVGGKVIDESGPGEIVGEMALIDQAPRSATAVAAGDVKYVVVDRQRFLFLVQDHPTFALQVMELMAARLRRANLHRA